MTGISLYLLAITGAVVLLVVIDLVLPDSQISKYIKSISAIFLVVVICTPVVKLLQGQISFQDIWNYDDYVLDQNYLYNTQLKEAEDMASNLEVLLDNEGYKNIDIIVNIYPNQTTMKINTIFADLSKLVLSGNSEHINKYTAIKELIIKYTGVEEDKIIIDG